MLKEGDIVKINDLTGRSYPSGVCDEMRQYANKIAVIKKVCRRNEYFISQDPAEYTWNREMFVNGEVPYQIQQKDLPVDLYSSVFGKITLISITDDPDYPFDIKLKDDDIISVTKEFKYFKDSNKPIF